MKRTTDELIAELARDGTPVRRMAPPWRRALLWLVAVAMVTGLAVGGMADIPGFLARASHVRFAIELTATLATGIVGVVAAFYLSLPDRSRSWVLAPLPPMGLWIAASGYECWKNWTSSSGMGGLGESAMCFAFILAVGLALGLLLYWPIRRARPIDPGGVILAGGLGVAGLASFVLQFFHPFDVTFMDLGVHLAAVSLLIAALWSLGRRTLAA
jgi:hypothetical protein